jgi:hypothetical protein
MIDNGSRKQKAYNGCSSLSNKPNPIPNMAYNKKYLIWNFLCDLEFEVGILAWIIRVIKEV